ncbi:neurofilament medium polypeptide-like isoform X2 [Xenopus laevis]|uniref:Neurofilament medium polypeptide-like isoform X1 n=2 Tax=Xenopus laevis TaxID=8355 RepID=A0A8J1LCS7_XENLA|nr:neurofilament medium polypeptide-like isoform X1 [Xenopus laevis]XP_041427282.1 neurofilament medium polypeptide-like isoform X2 [Xenopus laevis]
MDKKQRNPSLLTLYSVLKDFRGEHTDFEALASYYEHHYRVEFGENIVLKHFLLTCDVDPRMRAKENIMHFWKMLNSLEVIKREYAALRKSAKLPPDHPTRVQNRRKQLEYLRLENTINQHLTQLHHEFLRELKLKKAAGKKQAHSPAAEEEEDGAPAAADEEALDTEDKEEEAEGAPAEDPAVEEKMMEEQAEEEAAPGAAEEEALASQEKEEGAEDKEEEDAPTNEETAPPAEQQQIPEEEEKEEGAEVGGSADENQTPRVEEKTTEEQSPAVEEKEEGVDGEEEAPEVEEIIKDPLERPTLRKQFRKAIMKMLRRVWHSTQRLTCCCCCCCCCRRPNTMA